MSSSLRRLLKPLRSGFGKAAVILPATMLMELGVGMKNLGIVFFMSEVRAFSASSIGWFAAVSHLCFVCGCIALRPLIGRILPRHGMIGSTALMGVLVLGILYIPSIPLSFVLHGLYGLTMAFFWPLIAGWLSVGLEGTELGKTMSRLYLLGSVGIILGPYVGGVLSDRAPTLPIHTAVFLFFFTAILVTIVSQALPRVRRDTDTDASPRPTGEHTDRSTLLRYPAWAGLLGTFIVLGVIYNTFPIYGNVDLDLKKSTIGALLLARALGNGAGYLVWGRTRFWQFRVAPSIVGLLVMALLVLLLPTVRSLPLLVAVMTLMGPLNSFALSYSVFHAVTGSNKRSQRMAINEALLVSGIMIGSIMGGTVYQHFSMTMVSVVCAALLIMATAVQIPLFLRARRLEGRRFE